MRATTIGAPTVVRPLPLILAMCVLTVKKRRNEKLTRPKNRGRCKAITQWGRQCSYTVRTKIGEKASSYCRLHRNYREEEE